MKQEIVRELTPEIADKIWKQVQKKIYDDKISKEAILHYLKQLKAQMGKVRKQIGYQNDNIRSAIDACTEIIDKKIAKVKGR